MKLFMGWFCWWTPTVSAIVIPLAWRNSLGQGPAADSKRLGPRYDDRMTFTDPETGKVVVTGETNRARTVYTIVSLSCAVMLALTLGGYMFLLHL